jgi:hypothetical protein
MCSPLDTDMGIDPERRFDEWEYVLYIMTLAFLIEGKSLSSIRVTPLTFCRGYQSLQGPYYQLPNACETDYTDRTNRNQAPSFHRKPPFRPHID